MGGKTRQAKATLERRLHPEEMTCRECGQEMQIGYTSWRKVVTLEGMLLLLKVSIRRCENRVCERYRRPSHPLEEGRVVLPHYEYGLDVVAFIGAQRYRESAPGAGQAQYQALSARLAAHPGTPAGSPSSP